MNAIPKPIDTKAKVIDLSEVIRAMDKQKEEKEVRLNKDGTVDKRHCNKVAGVSSEVYPFTEEEVGKMLETFDKKIENAPDGNKRWVASRNKMMFVVGINSSLRVSDLCGLTYSFIMNDDGTFKDQNSLQPKKTKKKTGKFVKVFFNEAARMAITNYLKEYPMENMNEYLFKSREGDGHLTEKSIGRIIKDTAEEVGVERNINSHSMRKTFGSIVYHRAVDKNNALIILQTIFNHSSPAITSRYIGLTDGEMSDIFNELNIGLDYLE